MTLIISEVSKFGIAMAADSAEISKPQEDWDLPGGRQARPVGRTGAQKLVKIKAIPAAISGWGIGLLGTRCQPHRHIVPMDEFLSKFADEVKEDQSLEEVGTCLAECVNERTFPGTDCGFHLAGYSEEDGQTFPVLYHIHLDHPGGRLRPYLDWPNIHSPGYNRAGIRGWREELAEEKGGQLFNGELDIYRRLAKKLYKILEQRPGGFVCPYYDASQRHFRSPLEVRGRYLKLLIEIVCQLYLLSNKPGRIAMPVSWLIFSEDREDRIDEYHPAGV